jgi:hypothetical protein
VGTVILGNELALDVNVLWLLILSLFFVFIVTAAAVRVIGVITCAGVLTFGLAKARAEVRAVPETAAETDALEAEAEAAVAEARAAAAEATVAEAEAVIAAAQLRLFGEAGS